MSVCGKFELEITTSTQEEMDRIAEAIYSGYAETIIKQHVLWSQFMPPAQPIAAAPAGPVERGPELQRVATRAKAEPQPSGIVKKEPRATGIIGRGRLGRTQK